MESAVRFAPNLTSRLTVAGARLALINWLHARKIGGGFVLRLDDADVTRARLDVIEAIREDLRWLGLSWDAEASQERRLDRYERMGERMKSLGRLYPCWETAQELEERRRLRAAKLQPLIYDRASLLLPVEVKRQLLNRRRAHWRLYMEPGVMSWVDLVLGPISIEGAGVGDPVAILEDGTFAPFFRAMVDDTELGISDVVRGEDQAPDTVPQLQMAEALRVKPPRYGHLPGLVEPASRVGVKALAAMTLAELREGGMEPMAVNSLLVALGTTAPPQPAPDLDTIATRFDFAKMGRTPVGYDPVVLGELNRHVLREVSYAAVEARLRALGVPVDEAFWIAVRGDLHRFGEVEEWWRICREKVTPRAQEASYLRRAGEVLPAEPWTRETARLWAQAVQANTGRQGRMLMEPLKLALTGKTDGPDLQVLLPLIGRDRAMARLRGEAA